MKDMKNINEKNMFKFFEENFKQSTKIDETYTKLHNTEGEEACLAFLKEIGAEGLSAINYEIIYKLAQYTKNELSEEDKKKMLNSLTRHKEYINFVKTFDENNRIKILISTKEGLISSTKFSSMLPKIIELNPSLETSDRGGLCHSLAYDICLYLKEQSTIVTGYVYGYTNKSKFLHSWVELSHNGSDYVIDGTLNIMMDKTSYYRLRNAQPLTKITKETLTDDINKYYAKIGKIPIPFYFIFRDEIIKDFQKNQEIFDNKPSKHS